VVAAVLKVAVTPLGIPETLRATLLLNPFWPVTLIVLLAAVPPARRVKLLYEVERVKLGAVAA